MATNSAVETTALEVDPNKPIDKETNKDGSSTYKNSTSYEAVSQNSSEDADEPTAEMICLDDVSDDSDDYDPEIPGREESYVEVTDESSGDEEAGVNISEYNSGMIKLYKLKFDDVEQKQKEYLERLQDEDSDSDGDKENDQDENVPKIDGKAAFSLREDIVDYKSDEDDDFDVIHCGEAFSDIEYDEGEERDTESEVEVDVLDEKHKKTGETLKCIRMIEELKIPPTGKSPEQKERVESAMDFA